MFCAKMSGCSHYMYCLQKESTHFGLRGINKFWSGGIGTVLVPKNRTSKIRSYSHTTQTTNYLVWVLD